MTEQRDFHLGDILSITTGRLLAPRGVDALYPLLSFLAGRPVFTHELPDMADTYTPLLLEQHPQLAEITVPDGLTGKVAALAWIDEQTTRYGRTLTVTTPDQTKEAS